jgi:GrpB-like predicted nucleotidyltransferase (UPF0157 family)
LRRGEYTQITVSQPITIVDYEPAWPLAFQSLQRELALRLGNLAASIEHVGSTSVPGLAAKPILDVDVTLAGDEDFAQIAARLNEAGYIHQGDLGIPKREAFLAPPGSVPLNLYVCLPSGREHRRHLAFRDYLRSHPSDAANYAALKRQLAVQFPHDRTAYVHGKSAFIEAILARVMAQNTRS